MTHFQKVLKRILDILVSLVGLTLSSPLLLVIALVVVIDSGRPAIFIQQRLGQHGRSFHCYKFRTMKTGTFVLFEEDGSTKVLENDPRLTRVGGFLRRLHLDELPQLLNVLVGQMSLVGPRPDLLCHWELRDATERLRYTVKPGITGLAQVNDHDNRLTAKQKISYDLQYIGNYSLMLDLRILLKTFLVVFRHAQ